MLRKKITSKKRNSTFGQEYILEDAKMLSAHLKNDPTKALGAETGGALEVLGKRRFQFLRCSGMHGDARSQSTCIQQLA